MHCRYLLFTPHPTPTPILSYVIAQEDAPTVVSLSVCLMQDCVLLRRLTLVCVCVQCVRGGFLLSACMPASVCVFAHVYVCFSEHDLFLSDLQAVSLPLFLRLHSHSYPLFLSKLTLYMCLFLFHPMLVDRKRVPK